MRKTRLVILPGARCLHQLGFLLLFLACPTIAFKGQENRDIQPYSRLLILKQNWIPTNTGKGIGCNGNFEILDEGFGFWNSDNGNGNFCHNNNTRYHIKNCLNASTDQQHFKILEKKSDLLEVSRFQKDGSKIDTRRLQRQVRSLAEVKRIQLDNTRINLDTRRESLSRSFSRSRLEKRAENGRMHLIQERRERQNSEEINRKYTARQRSNAFFQNRKREIDSASSRRITERRDSRFQTANNRFNSERSRRQDLAHRRNDRIINSISINNVMEIRDSQNRVGARYMRENLENSLNPSLQRNIVKREVQRISRDTMDRRTEDKRIITRRESRISRDTMDRRTEDKRIITRRESRIFRDTMDRRTEDKRIITRRESRIFSRENIIERRFLIQDSSMVRSLGEMISENNFFRTAKRNSEKRRSLPFLERRVSLSSENGRISVRENSFARSDVRNNEDGNTLDRKISSYGLIRRKIEYRTLIRERRSVGSMDRNSLRQLPQRRILSEVNSMERSFNRENPLIHSSRGNPNYRNNIIRDNSFTRSEARNLEGRTLFKESRFSRSLARDEYLAQSLLRNSEGRRSLDREQSLIHSLTRNSVHRRTEQRDDSLSRSFQRNSMERRNVDQELPLVYSERRDLEYRRSIRRSASPSRSFRRVSEERRILDRKSSLAYSSRRDSELTRSLSRSDSSSRVSQRDSERRTTLDRRSLPLYSTRRYSESERSAVRDDSLFSRSQRTYSDRRSLAVETIRINSLDRRSATRTDYLVRSFERKLDERRTNARDTVSRESLQRNPENKRQPDRKVSAREIPLIRLERSRISRESTLASLRRNIRKSENAGVLRRENIMISSRGFSSRFGNERGMAFETSFLRDNRMTSSIERSDRRNDDLVRGTQLKIVMQRFEDRRFSVGSQTIRREVERTVQRRTFKSGERNNYAANNFFRNIDSKKRTIETRANDYGRRILDDKASVLSFRIRNNNEPSSLRRIVGDERLIQRTVISNDRFLRQSLSAEFRSERKLTRNSNVNEDLIKNVEERSLLNLYRSDLRMSRRLTVPTQNIRFERKSSRITRRSSDLSDSTRFLVRSLEVRVLAERRNSRQIRQEPSGARSFARLTENSPSRSLYRYNNNRFQQIVNFREIKNEALNSKQTEEISVEQFIIYSWFNQLLESIKQVGRDLYDGTGKLNLLKLITIPSMKGNGEFLENRQDNFNGLWNNKRHAENSYLPGAITGGILCASLYLNVQKREVY